jgi:hypothetical protein
MLYSSKCCIRRNVVFVEMLYSSKCCIRRNVVFVEMLYSSNCCGIRRNVVFFEIVVFVETVKFVENGFFCLIVDNFFGLGSIMAKQCFRFPIEYLNDVIIKFASLYILMELLNITI